MLCIPHILYYIISVSVSKHFMFQRYSDIEVTCSKLNLINRLVVVLLNWVIAALFYRVPKKKFTEKK